MGSGTEVAKEASDLVIVDDNFKSIKDAIWYGRTIYNNILKFCKFQLSINVGAVLLSAIAPFIGIEEPLTVTHLLYVNLVMDSLGSIMLGAEPALERYMKDKPKRRDEKIVQAPMFIQFVIMGIYFTTLSLCLFKVPAISNMIGSFEQVKTANFAMFIFCALFNGFNVRAEGLNIFERISENTNFFKVWGAIATITVALTFVGGKMFSCVPFGINGWAIVLIMSISVIPVDMLRKVITKAIMGNK